MTTPSKVVGISLLMLLMATDVSADTLLYDNGPDAFSFQATDFISFSAGTFPHNVTNLVTDDFTLSADSTLDKVVFAELSLIPNGSESVPQFVNFAIGTTPFASDAMGPHTGGGTGLLMPTPTGTMELTPAGSGEAHDYSATFALPLPNIFLPAGTYYLTLDAATNTAPLANDYWALTDATSGNAMSRSIEDGTGVTSTRDLNNEPSFQIYGMAGAIPPPTGIPEPATWGLLVLALLALTLLRLRLLGSA